MLRYTTWRAQMHRYSLIFALSVILSIGCAAYALETSRTSSADTPDPQVSPTFGRLEPGPQGEADQARILESLIRQLQANERDEGQVDAYFITTQVNSLLFAELMPVAAQAEKSKLGPGMTLVIPSKEALLTPRIMQSRWAFSNGKTRYESRRIWGKGIGNEKTDGQSPDDQFAYRITAYDGATTYSYRPDSYSGTVSSGLDAGLLIQEASLTLINSWGKPLSELLQTPSTRYEGRQMVGNTECLKVSQPIGSGLLELWISPENGYRVKCDISTRHATAEGEYGNCTVSEVEDFQQYGTLWFPVKGRMSASRLSKSGIKEWLVHFEWHVTDLKPVAPDSLFQLQFPLGTNVMDSSSEKVRVYIVGKDN